MFFLFLICILNLEYFEVTVLERKVYCKIGSSMLCLVSKEANFIGLVESKVKSGCMYVGANWMIGARAAPSLSFP